MTKVDAIAAGGLAIIWTTSPICVRVYRQVSGGTGSKIKTIVDGVFEVTEYTLDFTPVNISGPMHELAYFVDCK